MGKLITMKATKEIKQRAKALATVTEPEPKPQQWAEWEWPPLKEMRPYDVAHLAEECMNQLHDHTNNGTLDKGYEGLWDDSAS